MKIEKNFNNSINSSFFLTFLTLTGTTIITLLAVTSGGLTDSKANGDYYIKNALISETSVNIIAGLTYYYMIKMLHNNSEIVTPIRYLDWVITTPLLLLSFIFYLHYKHNKSNNDDNDKKINFLPFLLIILFNFLMILSGYLGEVKKINKYKGLVFGFIFFIALFYVMYHYYVKDNEGGQTMFYIFVTIWAFYGLAYLLSKTNKHIAYNILDMISKAGFGIVLWLTVINDK